MLLGSVSGNISKGSKSTKDRKIGDVIGKVCWWRRLYNGVGENGETIQKKSLENAADIVKISKKSLDDYLLQL